ncbi:SDR family oxidoreductase [Gammaproteobacteria bacterium]|nr:SDR family oxidoreductase [Gammaproteobacteria bacterium]
MILVIGKHGQLAKCFRKLEPDACFLSSQQLNFCETKKIQDILSPYKPAVICNFSAFNNVDDAEKNNNNNLINSEAMLELGKFSMTRKIPIIHISTDYVFDGIKGNYLEDDRTNPINEYGLAKLNGERNLLESSYSCLIIRTAWLYSRFKNNFLEKIILNIIDKKELSGADDCIGSPTSASSLASAINKIIPKYLNDLSLGGIYHFANQGSASRYELIQEIQNLFIHNSSKEYMPLEITKVKNSFFNLPAKRPHNTSLNSDKILSTFDIEPSDWKEELNKEIINR